MLLSGKERSIYFLLSGMMRQNVGVAARRIRERAYWPKERLDAFRLQRCQRLLAHASAHVPYYRELFKASRFDPTALASLEDLSRIRPLQRNDLRDSFEQLKDESANPDHLSRRSTGGTSGQPVTVLLDKRHNLEHMLVNHRMYALMGRHLGTHTFIIAGNPIDFAAWNSARDRVKNRLFGVTVASSFDLTPSRLEEIQAQLKAGNHPFVLAYASVFDILAAQVERSGEKIRIPHIIPCAELVTQAQRERWKTCFQTEIFEIYGSREMPSIAGETIDHHGLAINEDLYHIEITDDAGTPLPNGESGLITITNLMETGLPLIRYQLGDMGSLSDPPADSPFPFRRLTMTHGRVLDLIRCPDGKLLPGEFFPHLMKEVSQEIERFQVVQVELDRLVIKLVATESFTPATTRYLEGKIREQTGPDMHLDFEQVEAIETSKSGKYRPTLSLLSSDSPQKR